MKKEIKEIQERLNYHKSIGIEPKYCEDLITTGELQRLLDYITNLQEKVNQYENPDDLTLFYMWLDVKAKDKMKQLQEENERLKELCDKYEEEHNTAFKLWTQKMEEMPNYEEFVDYKSRNEKAINILELSSQNKSICTRPETDTIQSALNILKGGISKYE